MSKYIIVEKDKYGNERGTKYTITYQVDGEGTNKYKVDMYCISEEPVKYCYIAENYGYKLDTMGDRNEFLEEFYKFQKGGSYRKTHPIKYSKRELLQQQIEKYDDKIYQLKKDLVKEEDLERQRKFEKYYDDVDTESLNTYANSIVKVLNSNDRFYISNIEFNIWEGHRLFVSDRKTNKVVKYITVRDKEVKVRDLTVDDMHLD